MDGAVVAGVGAAAPMIPGTDVWPGLLRACGSSPDTGNVLLVHHQDDLEVSIDWQLASHAILSGSSLSKVEVRYQLVSPVQQSGQLIISWLPTTTGTGQCTVGIDVYDDGYVDSYGSAVLPVAFQQLPLTLRVTAEASSQAGTLQGPWGSSWSWSGTAAAQLQIRFVPDHATSTTQAVQTCVQAPALEVLPDLREGVTLQGQCSAAHDFAVFALGFQQVSAQLPISPGCLLLVDPVVTALLPVSASATIRQHIPVPVAVRPNFFLAQLLAFDATAMTLAGSDLLRIDVQ